MKYQWNYQPPTDEDKACAEKLAGEVNVNVAIAQMLVARGVRTQEQARAYFRPQLLDLHDPYLMKDMDRAVERLNEAMGQRERIMIYGDYDVDGCTAVALVYRLLIQYYSNLECYIPDRSDEGYGVSVKGVDYAASQGVKLIIVLDCGIKATEEVKYAKEKGIDFIICDHHVPDDELPPAVAILNAKRVDNTYPYQELSGCGVGFKLMQAFAMSNGIPFSQLIPLLDLCAISIASDIVPVMGENRILAYHGLRQLNNNPSVGVKALLNICGLVGKELTMSDIVFKIGPRINASGRVQNGKQSVDLLVERDADKAKVLAETINEYNEERKELDKRTTEESSRMVAEMLKDKDEGAIVIYNPDWHKGVIGIVASRLTEEYFRPAVVLTLDGGIVTGSARSVSGFDVYKAIQHCEDLMENFGGHTYAAGLSMKAANVEEFTRRFKAYVTEHIDSEKIMATLDIHAVVNFRDITHRFHSDLKRMRPFGPDNPKPMLCTMHVFDYGTSKVVGRQQEHIKLELVDSKSNNVVNGIAFGQSSEARYIKTKGSFDIVYSVEENARKHGDIQLQIEDIRIREQESNG